MCLCARICVCASVCLCLCLCWCSCVCVFVCVHVCVRVPMPVPVAVRVCLCVSPTFVARWCRHVLVCSYRPRYTNAGDDLAHPSALRPDHALSWNLSRRLARQRRNMAREQERALTRFGNHSREWDAYARARLVPAWAEATAIRGPGVNRPASARPWQHHPVRLEDYRLLILDPG